MKKQFLSLLIIIVMSIANTNAQPWNLFGGNNITFNEYLGGDGSSTVPLRLKNIANQPIEFHTDNLLRMKLNETLNYIVNFGTSLSRDGYLLLGQNSPIATQGNTPIYNTGAFSLLHLIIKNSQ